MIKIEEFIISTAKIAVFIVTIPLVFLYLFGRQRVEAKLRKLGKWPY